MVGRIIKNISNDYTVETNDGIYVCKPRGLFRNNKQTPLVGDMVRIDPQNNYILEIFERKNSLIRPTVSNIDQAFVITSVKEPDFSSYLLDKLLTIISYNNIDVVICFTKLDLLSDKEKNEFDSIMSYYEKIGYKVVTNQNTNEIKHLFKNKITVFTGQSGSGKSSLLNLLDKSLSLKTAEISKALNRGKHTTRHIELFKVYDGYIVDTPGFSAIDFTGMSKIAIRDNFKEMFDNLDNCKYRDCLHIKEDGCYIKKQVSSGEILKSRYDNYCKFIEK